MARRKAGSRTQLRALGALLLAALVFAGFAWWHLHHWRPDRGAYPVQGVEVGSDDGAVDWRGISAIGADFAYIDASAGAFAHDSGFVGNFEEAKEAGLQVGAVHRYDPCQPADRQAANFMTVVPRDPRLLPPAVELDGIGDECPVKVGEAAIESELTTFLNQIETHTGKPALLKVSADFESRYGIAARIDRNLWLMRNRFQPDYAGRPWTLWTANGAFENDAGEPLRWIVVQP